MNHSFLSSHQPSFLSQQKLQSSSAHYDDNSDDDDSGGHPSLLSFPNHVNYNHRYKEKLNQDPTSLRNVNNKQQFPTNTTTTAPTIITSSPSRPIIKPRAASVVSPTKPLKPSSFRADSLTDNHSLYGSPPLSKSLISSKSLLQTKEESSTFNDMMLFIKNRSNTNSASSGSHYNSDDDDTLLSSLISSSLTRGFVNFDKQIPTTTSSLDEDSDEDNDVNLPVANNLSQSFHPTTEFSRRKQKKRNWFRFMKMESDDSSSPEEEKCDSEEEEGFCDKDQPTVDKKEVLTLFLLQHVAKQLNPDISFFVSLCRHLTKLGYFSSKMIDESFVKSLCKDFMDDVADIFPLGIEQMNENRREGIVRSESYSSYLSDISHSPTPTIEPIGDMHNSPILDSIFYTESRLKTDYHQFQKLGKAKPFSCVIKAKHRIDGRSYAIKRVKFHFRNTFELEHVYSYVFNEIKKLAKLDHENIVRYNAAWFEPYRDSDKHQEIYHPQTNRSENGTVLWNNTHSNNIDLLERDYQNILTKSKGITLSHLIEFESSAKKSATPLPTPGSPPPNMSYLEFALEQKRSPIDPQKNNKVSDDSKKAKPKIDTHTQNVTSSVKSILSELFKGNNEFEMVLYIVMQLCDGTTLEKWLLQPEKKKGKKNLQESLKIFKQIVKGVCHIHGRGLVHRNLKPNNIFVLHSGLVKIGDFGLAKYLQECLLKKTNPNYEAAKKSACVDMEQASLYASPEQIFNSKYDQKGDIYSLGVVLFELVAPTFVTSTERVLVLSQLKKREIPEEMLKNFPKEIEIVKMCLDKPGSRPTAQELLSKVSRLIKTYKIEGKFSSNSKHCSSHSSSAFPSFDIVREKNRQIDEQQKQIEQLRAQLEAMQSQNK